MNPKRILVPTDFSDCSESAFTLASALARRYGAELHLLHVVVLFADDPNDPEARFPESEAAYRRLEAASKAALDSLMARSDAAELTVHRVQRYAVAPAPEIIGYASENDVDLIVLGTHGRRGVRRFLLGSVAEETVRAAHCPVLTVRADRSEARFGRILVPFDFSADAERALETARALATATGADGGAAIDLLHVIAPPMDPDIYVPLHDPSRSFSYVELSAEVEKTLAERFATGTGDEPESGAVSVHVRDGHPAAVIAEFAAERGSDLIVLGSHGLSGLRRFLLGSVSQNVVRAAACPVLVMRSPEEPGA